MFGLHECLLKGRKIMQIDYFRGILKNSQQIAYHRWRPMVLGSIVLLAEFSSHDQFSKYLCIDFYIRDSVLRSVNVKM